MLTYIQAQQQIISLARSFGQETIDISGAQGRVLAGPLVADRDYPPFNRAAMDGYALLYAELDSGQRSFGIVETIFAGQVNQGNISAGQCFKIMTGAAVPAPCDIIIRREDTIEKNGTVTILSDNCRVWQNIARKGEDLSENETVLLTPALVNPSLTGILASLGKPSIRVEKLPRAAIFTTGDEVIAINQPVSKIQIRNSNQHLLKALLYNRKVQPEICEHVRDEKSQLREAFEKALGLDILIMSGGVSAGDADYVPEVLEGLGVEKLFHKVAIKPGKPFWCGQMPNGGMVFALPGNPFSCLVTFTLFIDPYLRACSGLQPKQVLRMPLIKGRTKKTSFDEFFPVRITGPVPQLESIYFNGSGDIRAGLGADGLGLHPAHLDELRDGMMVDFIAF
jgi:molybdopterin molybdotransferase